MVKNEKGAFVLFLKILDVNVFSRFMGKDEIYSQ